MKNRLKIAGICLALILSAAARNAFAQKIQSAANFSKRETGVEVELRFDDGNAGKLAIDFYSGKTIRFRIKNFDSDNKPLNLLEPVKPASAKYSLEGKDNSILIAYENIKLSIFEKPFGIKICNGEGDNLIAGYDDLQFQLEKGKITAKFELDEDDGFYGFGEKFSPLNKRGSTVEIRNYDAGDSYGDSTYIGIPFYINPKGYGLFYNTTWRTIYDLGKTSRDWFSITADGGDFDIFVITGSPKEIISEYTRLTGRAELVPKWALGLWHGTYTGGYKGKAGLGQNEFLEIAKQFRKKKIPCDVLRIDSNWDDLEGADYVWHKSYPEPVKMIAEIKKSGFKMSLHDRPIPYGILRNHPLKKGWLVPPENEYLDFTNSEAADWWWMRHQVLLDMGVDAFKPDIGEEIPNDTKFFNGKSGKEMHNVYASLYIKRHFEGLKEYTGKRAVVFARSGYVGSQKYPLVWAGDQHRDRWDILPTLIRAGQSIGLAGFALWSHDIGGIGTQNGLIPSAKLYIRWAQFGFFSPVPQTFGRPWREPWKYDTKYVGVDVLKIFRKYDNLRYRLLPYIYSLLWESTKNGIPIMRAMALEFPNDEKAWSRDLQYMFGGAFLAAPVVNPENKVEVYFPEGEWYSFWTEAKFSGGNTLELTPDIETMPLFVKAGSIIPMGPVQQFTGEKPTENLDLFIYSGSDGEFNYYEDDGETFDYENGIYNLTNIKYSENEKSSSVIFTPENDKYKDAGLKTVTLHLINTKADRVEINSEPLRKFDKRDFDGEGFFVSKVKKNTIIKFEYSKIKNVTKIYSYK